MGACAVDEREEGGGREGDERGERAPHTQSGEKAELARVMRLQRGPQGVIAMELLRHP